MDAKRVVTISARVDASVSSAGRKVVARYDENMVFNYQAGIRR